jgi:ABC-type sugar transport system substrate-binding protein
MRRASLAVVAALTLLLPLACNRGQGTGQPRVALVLKTLNNPFFIDMQHGAEGAPARIIDFRGDYEDYLRSQGV